MASFVDPPTIHAPAAGYHHHVVVETGRLLITSGQIGMRPDGTMPAGAEDQLAVAFDNVAANLAASGMTMRDVVKLTIFLVGELDTEVRRRCIAEALDGHRPTMSVLYVAGLGTPEMLVEIEAIAAAP